MDNIQKCDKTVYYYIYDNVPKAEELKLNWLENKLERIEKWWHNG